MSGHYLEPCVSNARAPRTRPKAPHRSPSKSKIFPYNPIHRFDPFEQRHPSQTPFFSRHSLSLSPIATTLASHRTPYRAHVPVPPARCTVTTRVTKFVCVLVVVLSPPPSPPTFPPPLPSPPPTPLPPLTPLAPPPTAPTLVPTLPIPTTALPVAATTSVEILILFVWLAGIVHVGSAGCRITSAGPVTLTRGPTVTVEISGTQP